MNAHITFVACLLITLWLYQACITTYSTTLDWVALLLLYIQFVLESPKMARNIVFLLKTFKKIKNEIGVHFLCVDVRYSLRLSEKAERVYYSTYTHSVHSPIQVPSPRINMPFSFHLLFFLMYYTFEWMKYYGNTMFSSLWSD